MKKLVLSFLILPLFAVAQNDDVPRDTSFTMYSAYTKEVKNYPFIKIATPSPPKNILAKRDLVYSTIGSRKLHLDVFYPSRRIRGGFPGVLLVHGGGWRSGDKSQMEPIAQQLAGKGYVAVCVEYRLALEAKYPEGMNDLKTALMWMREHAPQYNLDPKKIAALGCSSGGQMASLLATTNGIELWESTRGRKKFSAAVQAVVDIDGILAFKHPESQEGASASAWLGATYEQRPEVWLEASPLMHVDKFMAPCLFINSSTPRYHAGRDDMIRKLDSLKIYSEVHTLADTPHPFWFFDPWFNRTVEFTTAFLDKVFGKKEGVN